MWKTQHKLFKCEKCRPDLQEGRKTWKENCALKESQEGFCVKKWPRYQFRGDTDWYKKSAFLEYNS